MSNEDEHKTTGENMQQPKFIQLVTSDSSLTALAEDGSVWVYMGQRYGWSMLNMERLTDRDAMRVRKVKFGTDMPPQENAEYDDYHNHMERERRR